MGEIDVRRLSPTQLRDFARALLRDVEALETMLDEGAIQSGHRRIGCEQEMFLVDASRRPKAVALELLDRLRDSHFTTELGLFNLELNQDSLPMGGSCLSQMEADLAASLGTARRVAKDIGTEIALAGILPTLRKSDLTPENLTPLPRYEVLNSAMEAMGGGRYELRLSGADELIVMQDSVMLESGCTSFQVHYQTDPDSFVNVYNIAQAVTGPLLAAAVNSPLLFGRRLWQETRIPLFQQSIDTRRAAGSLRERSARVTFGERWIEGSVIELFREEIARLPIILGAEVTEDSPETFRTGRMPSLRALQIHNGTVYRWNRPCYGVSGNVAHLRIENRVLPAGPTIRDEIANAAFFFGLLHGLPELYPDIAGAMPFEHAQLNFLTAARSGLESHFRWVGGLSVRADSLILEELLPVSRRGLADAGVLAKDIDQYLGVVEERVSSGRTGSAWMLASFESMRGERRATALTALTSAIIDRQWDAAPVHEWPLAQPQDRGGSDSTSVRVEEAMTTDLLTVEPDEPVEMARSLMEWRKIRHLPVEDKRGRLRGILALSDVLEHTRKAKLSSGKLGTVREIMNREPKVIGPESSLREADRAMTASQVDYLIVVEGGRIAGILTALDISRAGDPSQVRNTDAKGQA